MSAEQSFEAAQRRYFLRGINREVPVPSTPADRQTVAAALGSVDAGAPRSARVLEQAGELMSTFGASSAAIQADQACRQLPAPSMSMRDPAARAGCGWWFVPNPSQNSRGAYGTRRGPMSPTLDSTVGAGQWIWDPYQASQMEAGKVASNITACPDIGMVPASYNMGWCTSTNRAIATDGQGNPAFPRAPGGDCPNGTIITNPANCPPPPSTGGGGGGGISAACSTTPLSPQCVQSLVSSQGCAPAGLLAQSLANGYIDPSQQQFSLVNNYLTSRQFNLDPAFYSANAGSSVDSVTQSVQQLSKIASSAPSSQWNSRAIAAANVMCNNANPTPAFDPCAFNPTDQGPFPAQCITQAALQMGYGASGALLPSNSGMDYWNTQVGGNWQNTLNTLTQWKSQADTPQPSNPQAQATAVQNVYGTTLKFPKQSCNNNGAFMYRYTFPGYQTQYFPPQGPQTHFLGRYLLKNGIPNIGSNYADQTPGGSILTEGQRIVFTWTPTQGGTYQFMMQTDDDVKMYINGTLLYEVNGASVGYGNWSTSPIINWIVPGQQYTVKLDFWNGGGPWSLGVQYAVSETGDFSDATWTNFPLTEITLTQDRRLPMIDLSFHKMQQGLDMANVTDTDGILTNLYLWHAPIGQVNGRPCMVVNGQVGCWNNMNVNWNQGVRLGAFKSITMMVCITQPSPVGKQPASLFTLYNVPSSISGGYLTGYPRAAGGPPDSWDYGNRPQCFQIWSNPAGTIGIDYNDQSNPAILAAFQEAPQPSAPTGQWIHYAFVWDTNFSGYSLWVNGTYFGHATTLPVNANQILEQIRIGSDGTDDGTTWAGGIQWFRAFDYQLGQEQITMDMNDAWSTLY